MHGTIESFFGRTVLSSGWALGKLRTTAQCTLKQTNRCAFPTWEQPSCEEVEDGKCAGSQSDESRPVHALVVLDHVDVDAAQPLIQSVGLHDRQVLSLLPLLLK